MMRGNEHRAHKSVKRVAALVASLLVVLFAGCASVEPATHGAPHDGAVASLSAKQFTTGSSDTAATKATPSGARNVAKDSIAPRLAKQPLDLTSLAKRLRETEAIGELSKIELKCQVDDLLGQFRAFHHGTLKTTLTELRRPYDLLVLRVLSLLQGHDPPLAAAIQASREAIWHVLADPAKFAAI